MSFVNWVYDTLASEDVIDLYFILSDLVDINLSDVEICESAYCDSLASAADREHQKDSQIPIGKQVF
ncbi:hypothetical protein ACFLXI_03960 [Chloroflexota bacterium]